MILSYSLVSPFLGRGTKTEVAQSFGQTFVFQMKLHNLCITLIPLSPDALINSAGTPSIPGDFPFHNLLSLLSLRLEENQAQFDLSLVQVMLLLCEYLLHRKICNIVSIDLGHLLLQSKCCQPHHLYKQFCYQVFLSDL